MKRTGVIVVSAVVMLAAVLSGCGGAGSGVGPGQVNVASLTPPAGRIAFESNRSGNYDIWIMNADGTGQEDLTSGDAQPDRAPCLSRDGKFIAYQRHMSTGQFIFVMNADGSGKKQITTGSGAQDSSPTWSPDDTEIAFQSNRAGAGTSEIYKINVNRTGLMRLSHSGSGPLAANPSWSPLGRPILYQREFLVNAQIYRVAIMGGPGTAVTGTANQDIEPAWAPQAARIAFAQMTSVSTYLNVPQIYTMSATGTNRHRITNTKATDEFPAWSPDGKYLAFDSNRSGHKDIYVQVANGGTWLKRLTTAGGSHPSWGPAI